MSRSLTCSNLFEANKAYSQAVLLDPTNATAHCSIAMIAQLRGDVRAAIRGYHTALSLGPQDPMATVLLEMALKEQVERLDPTTIPGLPALLSEQSLDPFSVPKVSVRLAGQWTEIDMQGNPAFGPLPADSEQPDFTTYYSRGGAASSANSIGGVTVEGYEGTRDMRAGARISVGSASLEIDEEDQSGENLDIGEGSTMDIEED